MKERSSTPRRPDTRQRAGLCKIVSKHCFAALLLFPLLPSVSSAQDWARKMFDTKSHDFGTVARASNTEYRFKVKNLYEETVHIQGVRSSCGCTDPTVKNPTLKTFEVGEIVAKFNTRSFQGQHSATLTVIIDKPYYAEVQLQVYGNVRSDVVFHPGSVQLGSVDQGTEAEKRVSVSYAGRDDWQIVDVRSGYPHLEVELEEVSRGSRRVKYDLIVRLKPTAPAGYIQDQLVLVTDDRRSTRIPLDVEGLVTQAITVSPQQMMLGDVPVGESVTKKLVVKGKTPFKILSVECDDGCFTFKPTEGSKKLHIVTVQFKPDGKPGKLEQTIRIRTDQGDAEIKLDAFATIVAAK